MTGLLVAEGFRVNHKRVARIWREEGLRVPARQRKRGRLWFNDGSCVRLRPQHPNHVWSYDFMADRTRDGRGFRLLTIIDEYTRECLAIDVARRLNSEDVLDRLMQPFLTRGLPEHIRSDNGPEFTSKAMDQWAYWKGVTLDFSRPGKPTDNGLIQAFNGRLRAECLNEHWFLNLADAQEKLDAWRDDHNGQRPHGPLRNMTPAHFAKQAAKATGRGIGEGSNDQSDGAPKTGPKLRLTG